jgi:hypothetical protein
MRYLNDEKTDTELSIVDLLSNAHRRLIDEKVEWQVLDALQLLNFYHF